MPVLPQGDTDAYGLQPLVGDSNLCRNNTHIKNNKYMKTKLLVTELRERLWDNPDVVDELLQRVPDDEVIMAFTSAPQRNEFLRMPAEVMQRLVAKAANAEEFLALCTEAAQEVDGI